LQRGDLSVEMQVFAWRCLGQLYYPRQPDQDQAAAALEKALSTDPDLVNEQTIAAAATLAVLSGPPAQRAACWQQAYRWLATRTEKHLADSARRPSFETAGWMRFRRWDNAPPQRIASRAREIRERVKWALARVENNLPDILKALHRADTPAAARLLEDLEPLAGAEKVAAWRAQLKPPSQPATNAHRPGR